MASKNNTYGVKGLRKCQLYREAAAGTIGVATTIWRGETELEDQREMVRPAEDVGYMPSKNRVYVARKGAKLRMLETPATFEQIGHVLDAGVEAATGVADGSGTGYVYTRTMPTTAEKTLKTYSFEHGDNQEVNFGTYAFVEDFTLSGAPGEAVMLSANWASRTADPNKYTASLVYVNATKKITDAASGLAGFLTGHSIQVMGTVSDDGIYTIATGGVAGEIVVTEVLPGETAVSSTVQQTFTAAATAPTVEEMIFNKGKLYIDAYNGTIGTTQITNSWLGFTLNCKTGWHGVETGDGRYDFSFIKCSDPEITCELTFEYNGKATNEIVFAKAGTERKMRLKFEGSAITQGNGAYAVKTQIVDLAGTWDTFGVLGENNGNSIVTGTFRAGYCSTSTALYAQFITVPIISAMP